jgi:hypothetical protein
MRYIKASESHAEAIEWAKRIPAEACDLHEVELRPLYEMEDFAPGPACAD